ncbi:MAG: carboxylating nicotinate-nucleotide diphosphorylase [Proteobacteria bacterium]|nr:carboxylating nicotinate-nucleotide diphosphorylase [Pseudomonadota bacterium]
MQFDPHLHAVIRASVENALAEDIGDGDLTAELVPASTIISATIVTRDPMTLAGRPWVDEIFRQLDPRITLEWQADDGDTLEAESPLCGLRGPARPILSGERVALNFLQTLSATATVTAACVLAVAGTSCRILDTRKTLPGFRLAQKYAVRSGGGYNHRIGLFDAILIKENHIVGAGGIDAAIASARKLHPDKPVEIEVESLAEVTEALTARADRILLDNFTLTMLRRAVALNKKEGDPPAELEASGGITVEELAAVAATGVDYISVGALTKNICAIDLSMRIDA